MRVLLTKLSGWELVSGVSNDYVGPEQDKIYEVEGCDCVDGLLYYKLKGFEDYYESTHFRPIDNSWVDTLLNDLYREYKREFQNSTSSIL